MKKALFLLMLIVACGGGANAQQQCFPAVNFSDYDSLWAATGPNGSPQATVFRSYQITGSAQPMPGFCPQQNVQHHEYLTTAINTVGNSLTTGLHCVTCYFNATVTTSLNMMPGDTVSGNSTGDLVCSVAGTFYHVSKPKYFEYAKTFDHANGPGTDQGTFGGDPVYKYDVTHYCSNGTPDYNPPTLLVNEPHAATDTYFIADAVMFRIWPTFAWSVLWPTGGATVYGSSDAQDPHECTHTGPQQP